MSVFRLALWDFSGRFANYFVLFGTSVVLTRLLTPEDFGVFGILLSVIAVSGIFLDLGFRAAIVQAPAITPVQLSTVFVINLSISLLIVLVLSVGSTILESFYSLPNLSTYITLISSTFVFNAVTSVPSGLIQRELRFKAFSILSLAAALVAGTVSVSMALYGMGVWSLVLSNVANSFALMIGCIIVSGWRPRLTLDLASIRPLWVFGSRLFGSAILETIFTRVDALIIPKLFSTVTLGYYNRAQSLDTVTRTFSATSIISVLFPVFARNQDDPIILTGLYMRALHLISLISFGMSGALAIASTDLITLLFSDRWVESAEYFRIMAITAFVYPTSALMVNLIAARGNSRAFLVLEIAKKAVLLPTYFFLIFGNVIYFLIALGIAYVVCLFLNVIFVAREIPLSAGAQLRAISVYMLAGAISIAAGYAVLTIAPPVTIVRIVVTLSSFLVSYGLLNWLFRTQGLAEFADKLRSFFNDKRNSDISSAA